MTKMREEHKKKSVLGKEGKGKASLRCSFIIKPVEVRKQILAEKDSCAD